MTCHSKVLTLMSYYIPYNDMKKRKKKEQFHIMCLIGASSIIFTAHIAAFRAVLNCLYALEFMVKLCFY